MLGGYASIVRGLFLGRDALKNVFFIDDFIILRYKYLKKGIGW